MHDKQKELQMFAELKELLCKDIKAVIAKGDITPPDYQQLDTAVDIYKDATTICAMLEYDMPDDYVTGYVSGAMRGNSYAQGGTSNGMSGMLPMWDSYDDGYSTARGRNTMNGRYMSRDDEMGAKLNHMMQTANTEQERQIISRMMNEMR